MKRIERKYVVMCEIIEELIENRKYFTLFVKKNKQIKKNRNIEKENV